MPMRPYDGRVTDTDQSGVPGPGPPANPSPADANLPPASPGERRLAYPPSDRYRVAEAALAAAEAAEAVDASASIARGVAVATVVAVVGAVAIVFLGGVRTLTEVLLIVAGFTGLGVGIALRWGAREHLAGRRRFAVALALALGAVALGQLGLWQYGRSEGGVLGLLDYLGQVYGPLVLVEFAAAGVIAWLAVR
jgi:hypothetical protein